LATLCDATPLSFGRELISGIIAFPLWKWA